MKQARLLLVSLVAVTLAPLASGDGATSTLSFASPASMTLRGNANYTGDAAADIRDQIDSSGFRNGVVTAAEVASFEAETKEDYEKGGLEEIMGRNLTLDDWAPSAYHTKVLDYQNAEGPSNSTSPLTFELVLEATFDVNAGKRHVLVLRTEEDPEGASPPSTTVIVAPHGYTIDSTTGLPPSGKVSGDKKQVSFSQAGGEGSEIGIVFARPKDSGLPGVSLVSVGVAVGLAVLGTRRRQSPPSWEIS